MRQEDVEPRHKKPVKPKHYKKESARPKILKTIIAIELILVMMSCMEIYRVWCHSIEMVKFGEVCSVTLENATASMGVNTKSAVKTYLESPAEEVYEYIFTTDEVEYRKGADMSYKSAGTLEKDKMVKRTAIMNNGWSQITVDDKDYYVPYGTVTTDLPESLPISGGIKGEYQKYALSLLPEYGWDSSELAPLIYLWERESHWNPSAHNRSSGAHGIPQALPARKMASEGSDYYTNGETQIRWGLGYIARRYGSPSRAWAHSQSRGWY